ncbi:capsular polysaccharide biosynthesis protein CapF, partial [Bacillus sp. D-CC]
KEIDGIYHLAGVNRPQNEEEFHEGNVELTKYIVDNLLKIDNKPWIVFSSSTQAELENPYGQSKINDIEIYRFTKECSLSVLNDYLKEIDGIYHLA